MNDVYKFNPSVVYSPSHGTFVQKITARDLTLQSIVVSDDGENIESFPAKFSNIFKNYTMVENGKIIKTWNEKPFDLWQSQLNFATFCASSACGVSIEHLNSKYSLVKSVYRFHVLYHIRRILKRLQVPLPYQNGFNQYKNPFSQENYLELCFEYGVDSDYSQWRNQYFFSTFQSERPAYLDENSWSRWILTKSQGFTRVGVLKISESARDYAYLILTSQSSARSSIVGNTGPSVEAQQIFMNNFENIVNRRVDVAEDIKRYQDTLKFARSKVDYVLGENIYMIPSDMNLRIGNNIINYNNEIFVSNSSFKIGMNRAVNFSKPKVPERRLKR